MSLEVKTCQPIHFQSPDNNLTFELLKTLFPEAIKLECVIPNLDMGFYIYRILMPYKFTVPVKPASFGAKLQLSFFYKRSGRGLINYTNSSTQEPFEMLAQDIDYIAVQNT